MPTYAACISFFKAENGGVRCVFDKRLSYYSDSDKETVRLHSLCPILCRQPVTRVNVPAINLVVSAPSYVPNHGQKGVFNWDAFNVKIMQVFVAFNCFAFV